MDKSSQFFYDVKRNLKNSEFAARLFGLTALITVVVYGFFGIRPLWKVIVQKQKLLEQIRDVTIDLDRNVLHLKSVQNDLYTYSDSLVYLEKYMPKQFNVQNYMLDFVDTASKSGFIVKSFRPEIQEDSAEINLNIALTGDGDMKDFVYKIEEMKRTSQIKSIKYSMDLKRTREKSFSVLLTIYKL